MACAWLATQTAAIAAIAAEEFNDPAPRWREGFIRALGILGAVKHTALVVRILNDERSKRLMSILGGQVLQADLHDENAIYLDTFIERTFDWAPGGPSAITKPWVGFIHVAFDTFKNTAAQGFLIGRCGQTLALARVADKGGFNKDRGHLGA